MRFTLRLIITILLFCMLYEPANAAPHGMSLLGLSAINPTLVISVTPASAKIDTQKHLNRVFSLLKSGHIQTDTSSSTTLHIYVVTDSLVDSYQMVYVQAELWEPATVEREGSIIPRAATWLDEGYAETTSQNLDGAITLCVDDIVHDFITNYKLDNAAKTSSMKPPRNIDTRASAIRQAVYSRVIRETDHLPK